MFSVFVKKASIRVDFVKLGVEPLASIQEALASISSAAEKQCCERQPGVEVMVKHGVWQPEQCNLTWALSCNLIRMILFWALRKVQDQSSLVYLKLWLLRKKKFPKFVFSFMLK